MTRSLLRHVERVPADSLELYPGNPRIGNVTAIAESLRENLQYAPLVAQLSTRRVLAGNHTLKAARQLGWPDVDVVFVDVDDQAARKILLASNRTADLGGYDGDALAEMLSCLDEDYAGTGWAAEDVDALLSPPAPEIPPGSGDPDAAPDAPADPVTAPGDVWHLGQHRLLVGDATDVAAAEDMLAGDSCDCMWTDPPYGVSYTGKTRDALTIRNDTDATLAELLDGAFAVATAAMSPGAAVYVAHAPGPLSVTFAQAFTRAGWQLRQNLIWVKDVMVLGHADYHYRHEPILFGYTAGAAGRRGRGGAGWHGDNSQTSVFEVPRPSRSEQHPTMKPVELVARCLLNSSPPGGLVYDPFAGSGSTLIAAHRTGRAARVTELDPRYADVICRRFEEHAGITPERRLPGGGTEPVSFARGPGTR
jgi:DNA modification methylase